MRLLARAEPAGLGDQEQHFGKPVDRAAHGVAADTNRELGAAVQADQVGNARCSFAAPAVGSLPALGQFLTPPSHRRSLTFAAPLLLSQYR